MGFKRAAMVVPFAWPQMVAPTPLNAFLDGDFGGPNVFESQSATKQRNILKAMRIAPIENCAAAIQVADAGGSEVSVAKPDLCPCLTATRTQDQGYWVLNKQRPLKLKECMRLQGLDPQRLAGWEAIVSKQMGKVVGNAINIKMFAALLRRILITLGRPVSR